VDAFGWEHARVDPFTTRDPDHFRRDVQREHLGSQLREMQRVFSRSTSNVENPVSSPDQGIEMAPHRLSLQSAGRGVGPHCVIAERKPIEVCRGVSGRGDKTRAHASTS
jgi:hypothetical protein